MKQWEMHLGIVHPHVILPSICDANRISFGITNSWTWYYAFHDKSVK